MRQDEQLNKIGNLISSGLEKYESIIFLIFLGGIILKAAAGFPVNIIMVLALSTLGTMYFLNAFSITKDENAGGIERFIQKIASFAESIGVIGILFKLQNWPGSSAMIINSSVILIILLPVILKIKSKKPELRIFTSRMILRIFLIAVLGLTLKFTSKDLFYKFGIIETIKTEKTE